MDALLAYSEGPQAPATSLSHTFPQDYRKKRFLRFFARDGPSHTLACTPTGKDYWSPKCSGLNYCKLSQLNPHQPSSWSQAEALPSLVLPGLPSLARNPQRPGPSSVLQIHT